MDAKQITDKQRSVLIAITKSEYQNSVLAEDLVDYPVWSFSVAKSPAERAVLGHLARAGLVVLDRDGDETVAITRAGLNAISYTDPR